MKELVMDLAIIGAGPAGLSAAMEAVKAGIKNIIVLERDSEAGGILQQCIHDGFGIHRFKRRLSGCQYAQRFIDMLRQTDVEIKLNTMVLEITKDKEVFACNSKDGMMKITCGAIILAMGCRERTSGQAFIYGSRPAGVLSAGSVQRYINIDGYLPGKEAVILGSGDIGLIMARRMTLEGIRVKGVYELMPSPGGLTRNIVQCLDDFNIPLYLSTTVTAVHGESRVTGVTVAKVDGSLKPIEGTEEDIRCDLLVLAVGLIPENELSHGIGIKMDKRTKGPVLDSRFMTSVPGVFAAGNVAAVFDLVDYVSMSGEVAARGAADYLAGRVCSDEQKIDVEIGENVSFVVPQKHISGMKGDLLYFMRVKQSAHSVALCCTADECTVEKKKHAIVAPPEMLVSRLTGVQYSKIRFDVMEDVK